MPIQRKGIRLTIEQQVNLRKLTQPPTGLSWQDFRGRPLAADFRGPYGEQLRAGEVLRAGVKSLRRVIIATAARAPEIIKPRMVTNKNLSFNVMERPVSVVMFRQFVEESGYQIAGHNAAELEALLADEKKSDWEATIINHYDAEAFVAWRKDKTGQDLRRPTLKEWLVFSEELRLPTTLGKWEFTQTSETAGANQVYRSLMWNFSLERPSEFRATNVTLRLIEDK
jgi:hypothetical protein